MAAPPPRSALTLSVDQKALTRVAQALREEADGKALRKDLTRELRQAVQPAVVELRASIRSAPSRNVTPTVPLRAAIARGIVPQVRTTGKQTGVSVRVRQTTQVRGFTNAGRRFNRRSFRHPVFGNRSVWVTQVGKPYWFDEPMNRRRNEMRGAALDAIEDMAKRIATRSR
jgi:hypothetical protein